MRKAVVEPRTFMMGAKARSERPVLARIWAVASSAFILLLAGLTLYNGTSVINAPTDVLVLLDGAGRMLDGQVPHRDFSNPIGVVVYALIAAGMLINGMGAGALAWACVLLLAVAGVWASWIAYNRLAPWLACAFVVFVSILCVATRPLGYAPDNHSYAMLYNRIGWVFVCILFVQAFIPPRQQKLPRAEYDALSLGVLVGVLFFTKITYAMVAVGAMALSAGVDPNRRRHVLLSIMGAALVFVAIWATTRVQFFDYLADIRAAGGAQSVGTRIRQVAYTIKNGSWQLAGLSIAWAWVVGRRILSDRKLSRGSVFITMQVAFVCAAAILLSALNTGERADVVAYAVGGLLLVHYMATQQPPERSGYRFAVAAFTILVMAVIATRDLISISDTTMWREYKSKGAPQSQRIAAPRLLDFVVPGTSEHRTQFWRAKVMPARINDGLALLRKHVDQNSRILVFATANPFPFALEITAPRGGPLWWDRNLSYNVQYHPTADAIFADVNLVMIALLKPDDDGCCNEIVQDMSTFYMGYLSNHFSELDRSETWLLLRRR
jgi:hypothetical protein